MGAGKSTVGRHLALRLGKEFVDSDHEIEARTGVKIPLIFELEGEAGFRKREAEMLDQLTQRRDIVLATGGGAILNESTRAHLKERGLTIYLSATEEDLWLRTRHDKNRPLLQQGDARQRLAELLLQREPHYHEVADLIIETGKPSVSRLALTVIERLGEAFPDFVRPATDALDAASVP